jgi:multiple sugar transport system permease protein
MGVTEVARQQVRSAARESAWRIAWRKHRVGYMFLAPYLILFSIFVILPVLTAIYLSFTYYNILQPPHWIGVSNYRLLFVDDDIFLIAIKNTFIFALLTGPFSYCASFMLAWLINRIKRRNVFTLAYYTPSITSALAMSVVWRYIFSDDYYGLANSWLIRVGILDEPMLWLQDQRTILPVIMIVSLWMSLGTGFLVFLAGLQNVPRELYEAGQIDGIAHPLAEMWYITLPIMRPQMLFGAVMAIVSSFAVFQVSVQLAGLPSALYAGHTIVTHLYDYAFIRFELGYASAIAVLLFVLTFFLGRGAMRAFRSLT